MRVLITGSNGLLGQKLLPLFSDQQSFQVLATSRGADRSPGALPRVTYAPLDVTQPEAVRRLADTFRPEVVINTAAMTNVDTCEQQPADCHALNVTAVGHLAETCRAHDAFLLHLSTDFVFDGTAGPYRETDPPHPISIYGQSKLDAEQRVQQSGLRWAIARTVLVYGVAAQMSRSNIVLWVKESLEAGRPIRVVDDQWRTPTLAEDLARGCALIVGQKATGLFHLSGREMMTPYDIARRTARFFGLDAGLITRVDGSQFTQPARRPPRTGFVITKAADTLGYQPCSFEEGLRTVGEQLAAMA